MAITIFYIVRRTFATANLFSAVFFASKHGSPLCGFGRLMRSCEKCTGCVFLQAVNVAKCPTGRFAIFCAVVSEAIDLRILTSGQELINMSRHYSTAFDSLYPSTYALCSVERARNASSTQSGHIVFPFLSVYVRSPV